MPLSAKKDKQLKTINYDIGSKIQHYSGKMGTIAGIKIINNYTYIYLIELMDYNRIWAITREVNYQE
jgi:starvation-inducible outer membrane lipoprotein